MTSALTNQRRVIAFANSKQQFAEQLIWWRHMLVRPSGLYWVSVKSKRIFFQNFRICFFKDFIKNPQTTISLTFLTHIISSIDGVLSKLWIFVADWSMRWSRGTFLIKLRLYQIGLELRQNYKSLSTFTSHSQPDQNCLYVGTAKLFGPVTYLLLSTICI